MKIKNLVGVGILGALSFSASAEMVNYRINTIVAQDNPQLGITINTPVAFELAFDTAMDTVYSDPYQSNYIDNQRSTSLNVDGVNAAYSNLMPNPAPHFFVSKNINGPAIATYFFDTTLDGVKITEPTGYETEGSIRININGEGADATGIPDLSTLVSNGPGASLGYVDIVSAFGASFEITSIDVCPDTGCGDLPSTLFQFEIKAKIVNDDPEKGLVAGNIVNVALTYDTKSYHRTQGDTTFASFEDISNSTDITVDAGNISLETNVSNRTIANIWTDPAANRLGLDMTFSRITATNESGMMIYDSQGTLSVEGTPSQPFDGEMINLTELSGLNGHIWIPVGQTPLLLEIDSIKSVDTSGSNGDTTPEDTAPINIEGNLQQISNTQGSLDLHLSHTGGDHVFFHYAVDIQFPSGFTWNLMNGNESPRIGLGQSTSGDLNVPVTLDTAWEAGEYSVTFKILSDSGLFATKTFSFVK